MIRLVAFLLAILAIAAGINWLADRPGTIVIQWLDYVAEVSVLGAFVIMLLLLVAALMLASALRWLWSSPETVAHLLHRRREQRGLDALSSGMIAVGAGDRALAVRYAGQARKSLPNAPLTHLLRAQAAQLTGDLATARRIFEAMLGSPDTEQLGLRGLFLEAQREGEKEAQRQFAERALALNAKLSWPVEALFELQCRAGDWQSALKTLAVGRRQNLVDKTVADRRRAVLRTAQAQLAEDTDPEGALLAALEAHRLAPDLVPAAAIAGRILASQGNTPRAARVLLRTWRLSPHPDLAATYAYARPGDSPRDRLNRMRYLCRLTSNDVEGPIALAITAIEAREWDEARKALEPLQAGRLTQRVCTLMARIEGEQHGHTGRVREWLARALNAARDPAWTADGVVSDRWAPVSPVTGALDAFRWRVPLQAVDGGALLAKVEELVGLGAAKEPALAQPDAAGVAHAARPTPEIAAQPDAAAAPATPSGATETNPPPRGPLPAVIAAEPAVAPGGGPAGAEKQAAKRQETPAVATSAQRPEAERNSGIRPRAGEPKIFVSPRAPDDPGPEGSGDELDIGAFRASAKA
jgi:HemY protein